MKTKRLRKFSIKILTAAILLSLITTGNASATSIGSKSKEVRVSLGVNDEALNKIISDRLTGNANESDWQKYLDQEYKNVESKFSWKKNTGLTAWSGETADKSGGDPSIDPTQIPAKDTDGYVLVYFGEQLRYALENTGAEKFIRIMSDIDLVGYDKAWKSDVNLDGVTIDGNNKTIYNLGAQKSFIDTTKKSVFKNITFDSAKLVSKDTSMLGIVGNSGDNELVGRSELAYVRVQNSLIFSSHATYTGAAPSYAAPVAESKNIKADHVASVNNIIYAIKAHTGGAFGVVEHSEIINSYSIDCTVIAGGDHSGGFVSCSDGEMDIRNSFTNNTVYGNKSTGVFIGAILPNYNSSNKSAIFENCFTSGTIEGTDQLGGFIGLIETNTVNLSISFKNCYSTSIVGMRQGGSNLGGFLGGIQQQGGKAYTFENCYAAGEVGAIDTNVSANRGASSVGGFIGSFSLASNNTFKNCFYDKQTTAMREWATGDTTGASALDKTPGDAGSLDYLDQTSTGIKNIDGIKGVLTSDSKKFGAGLASLPNKNYMSFPAELPTVNGKVGFVGFTGDSYNGSVATNSDWIYDGGNKNANSHNCMYPQLSVFFNSDDTLVRAYSYASASTVHEQVWDECTHGEPLDRKSYDTVRDLTMRFTLTSYVDNTSHNENVSIEWKKSDAKTNLYGEEQLVIDTFEKINSTKYGREYWTADMFAPGTEWVSVNFTVKGKDGKEVVGKRRLRIIPTSNIEAGNDHLDVTVGSKYNHAKDAYFSYSTAQRMAANLNDITTGVYPDVFPFSNDDPRKLLQKDWTLASNKNIKELFDLYDNKYQVSAEFMSNVELGINKAHKDNIINTYVYDVKKFNEITDKNVTEIIYIDEGKEREESAIVSPTLLENGDVKAQLWAKKLNGEIPFEDDDEGRYLIEYEWIRTDGRFVRDAKMVMVQPLNHKVSIEVKNHDDDTINADSLLLSAVEFDGGTTRPSTHFGTETKSTLNKTVEHFKSVDLAFKNINVDAKIKKIKFVITTKDLDSDIKQQTVTIDPVELNTEFSVPITYYYSSFEEGGKYYAKKVSTDRKYSLKRDTNNDYYYLTMNNEFVDNETGFTRSDLESDVKVTIYVQDTKVVSKGAVSIINKTFDNGNETNVKDVISYTIKDKNGDIIENFSLDSNTNNKKTLNGLEVGNYVIERKNSDLYSLQDITINNDDPKTVNTVNFDIVKNENTQIVIRNVKEVDYPIIDFEDKPTSSESSKSGGVDTGDVLGNSYGLALLTSLLIFLVLLKTRKSTMK